MVSPVPNYSKARRDVIVAFIRAEGMLVKLDARAVLIYTVLALIVDADGSVRSRRWRWRCKTRLFCRRRTLSSKRLGARCRMKATITKRNPASELSYALAGFLTTGGGWL
jgi:hypothetical protein